MEKTKNFNKLIVYVKNNGKFVSGGFNLEPKQGRGVFKTTYSFAGVPSIDNAHALIGMMEDDNLRPVKAYYNHRFMEIQDRNEEAN